MSNREFLHSNAMQFLIGCLGVAVVLFAIFGGIALAMHNGASQTCAHSGGHWNATDNPEQGGVERLRECVQ